MKVKTEVHDGLEFEVPTWDPTPVSWNDRGSWVKDPELTERILAGIRAAVPNHEELVAEALTATRVGPDEEICRTYWGSHGCDRPVNHPGLCVCTISGLQPLFDRDGPCSAILKYGESNTAILWWGDDVVGLRLGSLYWTWFE